MAEPAFAGTNNYLVLSSDPARELTLATGRWPRSTPRPPAPSSTRPVRPPHDKDPEMLAYVARRLAMAVGTVLRRGA